MENIKKVLSQFETDYIEDYKSNYVKAKFKNPSDLLDIIKALIDDIFDIKMQGMILKLEVKNSKRALYLKEFAKQSLKKQGTIQPQIYNNLGVIMHK